MTHVSLKAPPLPPHSHSRVTGLSGNEIYCLSKMGMSPGNLCVGNSVYSLGVMGTLTSGLKNLAGGEISEITSLIHDGLKAAFQSLGRGEISTMTRLIYEAREKALERIQRDAEKWGADQVVGVKTHVYDLGSGLIEFLAIGTAVKKVEGVSTLNQQLPPQAIILDRDTYFEDAGPSVELGKGRAASARSIQRGPLTLIGIFIVVAFYVYMFTMRTPHM